VEYAEGSLCFEGNAKVGEDGRFSFTLFEGMRYLVRSQVNVRGEGSGQRHTKPVEVPANGDVSDIEIVISEPNGNCENVIDGKKIDLITIQEAHMILAQWAGLSFTKTQFILR
jgi:hypothetical protein